MRLRSRPLGLPVLLVLLVAGLVPATSPAYAAGNAQIAGSGSSWAANAVNQWVADVDAEGLKVVYTANGSTQGRKDFANRADDFAISDTPYAGTDPGTGQVDSPNERPLAYAPLLGGALAITYHLVVNDVLVKDLRLSGETLAKIFTGQITNWDDPAISANNGGRAVPSTPIIPVVRSDGAAETSVFTGWLAHRYAALWKGCNGGGAASTPYFPVNCGQESGNQRALAGADGVMNFVRASTSNGAIAVTAYSYALLANYPVAALRNPAGTYVAPAPHHVWTALHRARLYDDPTSTRYGTIDQHSVFDADDADAYPLSYASYAIIPTSATDERMTTAKRQALAGFLFHGLCEGQTTGQVLGYSPLPGNLTAAALDAVAELATADPAVDLTGDRLADCDRTTLDTAPPAPAPPTPPAPFAVENSVPPTITGTAKAGSRLTVQVGQWSPADVSTYKVVWRANGVPVPGATGRTYTPTSYKVGKQISATVTAHRSGYTDGSATSDVTGLVAATPVAIGTPALSITKKPTTARAGTAKVVIKATSSSIKLSGRTLATLTLTRGSRTVTRKNMTLGFVNGAVTFTVPALPSRGSWKAVLSLPRSVLVSGPKASRTVTVRVTS